METFNDETCSFSKHKVKLGGLGMKVCGSKFNLNPNHLHQINCQNYGNHGFLKLLICLELTDVCSKATFRLIKVVVATEFYGTLLKKSALIFQMMKRINFFTKMH